MLTTCVTLRNFYSDLRNMSQKVNIKYRDLRGRMLHQGTNPLRWAKDNGYPQSTVYDAAKGKRSGIKAIKIRKELEREFPEQISA